MNRRERQLYGRHVLLAEIGIEGQEALLRSRFDVPVGRAGDVASDYLLRAGLQRGGDMIEVPHMDAPDHLRGAADALAGGLAATRRIAATVGPDWVGFPIVDFQGPSDE